MKITILDANTLGDDIDVSVFDKLGTVTAFQSTAPENVAERIADSEIVVLNKVKLNESNLPSAKSLKLICITATGFDNVDIEYCKNHGIGVCNVAGYSTDSVVQVTAAMVFSLVTKLCAYDRFVKSGKYTESSIFNCVKPVFREMNGMTWGIAGLGSIGKKVAAVAQAMGCRVLAYKRTPVDEYECVGIDELCQRSDIITLHTPLSSDTYHLINRERLAMMKKNCVLVNVARGPVADEEAVTEAIEKGVIGGLGVDVYSSEPMLKENPYQRLLNRDNVIFTPHMAWGAYEARCRCVDEVFKNIESFLNGGERSRIV